MRKFDIIYGLHAVKQLLQSQSQLVIEILVSTNHPEVISICNDLNIKINKINKRQLEQLLPKNSKQKEVHQGIIAKVKQIKSSTVKDLLSLISTKERVLLLILDGIQDPHNLGACLRTADAAGVTAVITPKDNCCGLNATVHKVACGAAETVPFISVTNLARTIKELQQQGIWIVGTDNSKTATSIFDFEFPLKTAIVMGAEGKGMRALTKKHCDYLVKIPMFGKLDSLNVSVATGVILYQVAAKFSGLSSSC